MKWCPDEVMRGAVVLNPRQNPRFVYYLSAFSWLILRG
jgi:hypothetical protein